MTKDSAENPANPAELLNSEFLRTVAAGPGVYLLLDRTGRAIYVGKARNLRRRLAYYARVPAGAPGKVLLMLSKARRIETILTNTEKEALILEALLIKKQKPRYNIDLRDDKSYPLIKVTVGESWPRLLTTRRRLKDGSRYFGPYSSVTAMRESINYLNNLFPLRRCRQREFKKRHRACLNFQMGRCLAPCAGLASPEQYREMVKNVIMVLEGKKQQLIKDLAAEMKKNAAGLDFEEAARNRDRISSLRKTLEKQVMVAGHSKDQDIFGYARSGRDVAVSILFVRQGMVSGRQSFHLADPLGSDPEIITEVLKQFYSGGCYVPGEIMLPFAAVDLELLNEWLDDQAEGRVLVKAPKSGDCFRLSRLADSNARQIFTAREKQDATWEKLAAELSGLLRLARPPERLECLDISNLGGRQAVGSLVCFLRGGKHKSAYRRYRIRTVREADDCLMMAEVLQRRFGKENVDSGSLPDLLLLDGGRGQLNAAARVLAELALPIKIELAAIAKERDGQLDRLYRPGRKNPLRPARHSPALLYLMQVRDEAHRFAVNLHRQLRQQETLTSGLDSITGIGPARKKTLLQAMGSLQRISSSSVAELAGLPGISRALAERILVSLNE